MTRAAKALSRRKFLMAAGAGAAATAATLVARNSGSDPVEEKIDKRGSRGYRASEHVNNYYRTAKV